MALRVGVDGQKLFAFLARNLLFTSLDTFAVACIIQIQNTPKNEPIKYGFWMPPACDVNKLTFIVALMVMVRVLWKRHISITV